MKITLGKESIVYMGDTLENTSWGFIQFPCLYEMANGNIGIYIHNEDDAPHKLGNGLFMTSSDCGVTWKKATSIEIGLMGKKLPNGDILRVNPIKAKDVSDYLSPKYGPFGNYRIPSDNLAITKSNVYKTLPFPIDIKTDIFGGKSYIYLLDTLPNELIEKNFNFFRLKKNEKTPSLDSAVVNWNYRTTNIFDPTIVYGGKTKKLLNNPSLYGNGNENIVIAPDNSLYLAHYHSYACNPFTGQYKGYTEIFIFRSIDFGKTWNLQGYIPYIHDENEPFSYLRQGFSEPAIEFLNDGSMFCILRTCDVFHGAPEWGPTYSCRSYDMGKTWTKPEFFADRGALPLIKKLPNGVVVAIITRPGIYLYASSDNCNTWAKYEIMPDNDRSKLANCPPARPNFWQYAGSCCNTSIMVIDDDTFLLAYSDFYSSDKNGVKRKSIKVVPICVLN